MSAHETVSERFGNGFGTRGRLCYKTEADTRAGRSQKVDRLTFGPNHYPRPKRVSDRLNWCARSFSLPTTLR